MWETWQMCKQYSCLPTDLWPMYHPETPKGFYLNRGVFYFGRKIENEMQQAENQSRKNRKPGPGTDRLANAARLRVLEKYLGVPVKRHRDPGNVTNTNPFTQGRGSEQKKDESVVVMRGF
ncbi:tail assembly chaperone [Mycobacterium phage Labelle]|nr:tail assembly chaperone [Mycobacterium phage Labelle]